MIDLYAPILPGKGAGSVVLGTSIEDALQGTTEQFAIKSHDCFHTYLIYESRDISFYAKEDGKIWQIAVHGSYQGKINGKIGLGCTLNDVQTELGPVGEDAADNLVVEGVLGVCFEPEAGDLALPIAEIFVYEDDGLDRSWGISPISLT